jgi:S-adenosylmethionine/arginine decarboxylase-like enzyme
MAPRRHTRRAKRNHIEHHHLLLRMETASCPAKEGARDLERLLATIIEDIGMKALDGPRVYSVEHPIYNRGLTGIVPIQTSHIAFHFWSNPERDILRTASAGANCLLQFDLYTCGALSRAQICRVLHHLSRFKPTGAELTLLNRNRGLAIERHVAWDTGRGSWGAWLQKMR